jgi:hypothetical protein
VADDAEETSECSQSRQNREDRHVELSIAQISFPRVWRLTVEKLDVREDYIVAQDKLTNLIGSLVHDLSITDFQCVPYQETDHDEIWMTSRRQC